MTFLRIVILSVNTFVTINYVYIKLCVLLNRPFRSFFQLFTWTYWRKLVDTTGKSALK